MTPPEGWRFRCLQCGRYFASLAALEVCLNGRCPNTPEVERYNRSPGPRRCKVPS